MFGKKIKNVAVICHDAGAANLMAPWIKFYKYKYFFLVKGAAKNIFREYIPNIKMYNSLESIIKNSDVVITGTSTISDIENQARKTALSYNKKVIAVMDHWELYRESLFYKNKLYLPDEVWVTNKHAFIKAKKELRKVKIKKKINFFEQSFKKIKKNKKKVNHFLYFLEPINNSIEYLALKKFLRFLNNLEKKRNISIKFKLHPRENFTKYKIILRKFKSYDYKIVKNQDLKKLLIWSSVVFGLRSYALVLSQVAKRPVFSLLPINGFKNTLPYNIKILDKINKKQILIINK